MRPTTRQRSTSGSLEDVTRRQVLVQLDNALVEALDARARAAAVSRSELIRGAVADHLRDLEWAEADDLAMASYRRSPESWTGRGWPQE
jgi:predicted transcriptional regulator